ncbi:hypothetical protein GCM10023321_49050 [Pseudonocardia eucalypti]|uniref:Uncharacterized protein n=1 Tax=Pseudonocardia eucalypti TaxID=648755 RepID=A0ABP9QJP6_9PSEU|nr:hypothetical protein [Pseudonocardia eucalypti]
MLEHVLDGDLLFAVRAELRPQLRQPHGVLQHALIHQPVHGGGDNPLADRENWEQRLLVDQSTSRRVSHASPCVDHEFVPDVRGYLSAELEPGIDQIIELPLDSYPRPVQLRR